MKIKIKIKGEDKEHIIKIYVSDDYPFSKANEKLKEIVNKSCEAAGFDPIEEVKLTAYLDW